MTLSYKQMKKPSLYDQRSHTTIFTSLLCYMEFIKIEDIDDIGPITLQFYKTDESPSLTDLGY